MEQRLSLITLAVADLERARRFYVDGLGWTASSIGGGDVVFIQLGGIILGLFGRDDLASEAGIEIARGFGNVALAHNTRTREQVDEVLALAERAGGRIVRPAVEAPWGGYAGYFADPDDHLIEVAWNPQFPIDDVGNVCLPA